MRVCIVGKFPPLQGGTSVQTFWLAYRLAESGCEVTVVTATTAAAAGELARFREDEWQRAAARFPAVARIRVRELAPEDSSAATIPSTDALVTRLTSATLEAIDDHGCDTIIGSYLEPYGVAAHLAAVARDLPYVFMHAGSDLGRLARLVTRRAAYAQVLKTADGIITTPGSARTLAALRRSRDGLIEWRPILAPRSLFAEPAEPLEPRRPAPVVGMYGKAGAHKGTAELLAAVAQLRAEGTEISLLLMTGSSSVHEQIDSLGLTGAVMVIPFLPPWRVPEFLAACHGVCFLEHAFPIETHLPQVPREVATAGRPLVLSGEACARVSTAEPIVDGENALVVEDPRDVGELTNALRRLIDPEVRERLGPRARNLYGWSTEEESASWTEQLVRFLDDAAAIKRGWKMTLEAYQEALLRIYADPRHRRRVLANPSALDEIEDLAPAERASLKALMAEPADLERYARAVVGKRLHYLERQFSAVLDGHPAAAEAARREFHARWVLRERTPADELSEFEALLLSAGASALEPGARDGYVQQVRYAAMTARVAGTARHEASNGVTAPPADVAVRLTRGAELATFRGRPAGQRWDLSSGDWRVAAVADADRLEARVFELSPRVWRALAALEEPATIGSLADRLAADDDRSDVRAAALEAIQRLVSVGVLEHAD